MAWFDKVNEKAEGGVCSAPGEKRQDLLAVLLLGLLCTVYFANVLFTDQVLVSDSTGRYYPWKHYAPLDRRQVRLNDAVDRIIEEYPQRLVAVAMVRSRLLPLWNPYSRTGTPLLAADPLRGFSYPSNFLFYVTDPLRSYGYTSLVQLFLAATFMYFYLKCVELQRVSALCGAITFGLGGFFLLYLNWLDRLNTGAWMPLMFLSVERMMRGRWALWGLLLAVAIGMAGLAGGFGVIAYELLAVGLYAGWRLLSRWRHGRRRDAARLALSLLAALLAGALLSAVQLIPSVEALPLIDRADQSYEERVTGTTSFQCLAMAIIPDIFGNPADSPGWGPHAFGANCPGDYSESSIYAGFLPLVLAVSTLAFRRRGRAIFFGALACVSVAVFLDSPAYRVLYYFRVFRYGRPTLSVIMYFFSISVLASLGLDVLLVSSDQARRKLTRRVGLALCGVGLLAVVATVVAGAVIEWGNVAERFDLARPWYLYSLGNVFRFLLILSASSVLFLLLSQGRISLRLFALLAIFLVVIDLFCFGWRFNPVRSPRDLYDETEGIGVLRADRDVFRVIRGPGGKETMPPNTPQVYAIADAQGYGSLIIADYVDYMNLVEEGIVRHWQVHSLRRPESMSSRLLDLLNVKYIVTNPEPWGDLTTFVERDENLELVYHGDMRIYENKDVLPRAFVVTDHKVLRTEGEILAELTSEGFDPARYVILEQEAELHPASVAPTAGESRAIVEEYTPNEVTIEAEMSSHGFLVLSDLYYPGWKVFVDDVEQRIYKADHMFRAVQLEQGRHVVHFVFAPFSFKMGLGVTAVTFVAMCGWAVTVLVRMRRFDRA